jgi:hypothetical protein
MASQASRMTSPMALKCRYRSHRQQLHSLSAQSATWLLSPTQNRHQQIWMLPQFWPIQASLSRSLQLAIQRITGLHPLL